MKKLFVIAVCAGAIMLQAFRSDEDKNKGFAKMVFECIRKGDSVGFKKFFVTAIQFDSLVDKSTWTDEERERNKKRFTQHFLDSVIPITYHDIHSEYALNWKNVVVDSIIIKIKPVDGMESLSWRVFFTENKNKYTLSNNKVLKTANGWKMANKLIIYQEEKE